MWTLDLDQLLWSQVSTNAAPVEAVGGGAVEATNKEEEALLPPPMLPIAGHALVMWGGSILCIGGHTKVPLPAQIHLPYPTLPNHKLCWHTIGCHNFN